MKVGESNVSSLTEIGLTDSFAVRLRALDIFSDLFFDIVHLNRNVGNSGREWSV